MKNESLAKLPGDSLLKSKLILIIIIVIKIMQEIFGNFEMILKRFGSCKIFVNTQLKLEHYYYFSHYKL